MARVDDSNSQRRAKGRRAKGPATRTMLRPLVFLLPAVFVAAVAAAAVSAHEPVTYNPDDYEQVHVPETIELETLDLPEEKGGSATLELSMPQTALDGALRDGTYTGAALCGEGNEEDWSPYYIIVEITVKDGRVSEISDIYGDASGEIDPAYVYDAAENSLYLDRAIEGTGGRFSKGALNQIQEFIDSGEATGGVDTVSGSTFSVVSIFQAYNKAVSEAVAQSSS